MKAAAPSPPAAPVDDALTGLPGLRTWPRVYAFVVVSFIVWVVLLAVLPRLFA